jgi:uncharacterized phage-associated protein
MVSVLDVARYFVHKEGNEGGMTQLKLQKLCYYAQGFYLAIYQTPLFPEHIEAWDRGPVAKELRIPLRDKGDEKVIPSDLPFAIPISNDDITEFLDNIWYKFGHYKAGVLVKMTHKEDPWIEAYKIGQNTILSHLSMQTYFTTRKHELIPSEAQDSCQDALCTVLLKDGKKIEVPFSQIEAFVEENHHLIEPQQIKNGRKRLVDSSLHL